MVDRSQLREGSAPDRSGCFLCRQEVTESIEDRFLEGQTLITRTSSSDDFNRIKLRQDAGPSAARVLEALVHDGILQKLSHCF